MQQALTVTSVGVEDVLSIAKKPQWRNMVVFKSRVGIFDSESILSGRQVHYKIPARESRWAAFVGHLGSMDPLLYSKQRHTLP